MDFNTFKKNEFQNILAQFLHPSTINFYREKYGIEPTDFENNISSYEELYSTVGYAFLFFGNAIAKTLCDIRMCETTTMNRFQANEKDAFVNGAWYWIFNFKTKKIGTLPPTPMQYSKFIDKGQFSNFAHKFSTDDRNASDIVVFGPIPVPQERTAAESAT
jgi:hypothetical protein